MSSVQINDHQNYLYLFHIFTVTLCFFRLVMKSCECFMFLLWCWKKYSEILFLQLHFKVTLRYITRTVTLLLVLFNLSLNSALPWWRHSTSCLHPFAAMMVGLCLFSALTLVFVPSERSVPDSAGPRGASGSPPGVVSLCPGQWAGGVRVN